MVKPFPIKVLLALVAYLALETAVTGGGSGGSGSLGTDPGHGGNRRQAGRQAGSLAAITDLEC